MKKAIVFLALSLSLGGASSEALSQISFFDNFNRPDSQTVGNGWYDAPTIFGNHLSITDGQLTTLTTAERFSGIYRPFNFSAPVSISATLAETSGFGGLLERYGADIGILSDGTSGGYRVSFYRGDQNFDNSEIILMDGASRIASISPQIQFGHQIDVQLNFQRDGSVFGAISQNGQSESFSFGPHQILSSGANVFIGLNDADGRGTSNPLQHRVDNFSITSPIPEPESYAMLLAGLAMLGFANRRRQRKLVQA